MAGDIDVLTKHQKGLDMLSNLLYNKIMKRRFMIGVSHHERGYCHCSNSSRFPLGSLSLSINLWKWGTGKLVSGYFSSLSPDFGRVPVLVKKSASRPTYQIRAVARALDILEAFTVTEPELDLVTISERADLPKSTVFKILTVLENRGYVRKTENGGGYRIGFQAFDVGNRYLAGVTVLEVVRPFLKRLAVRFPQGVAHVAVLAPTETKIVYLDIVSLNPTILVSPIGSYYCAHCTALGKVLLAGLPDEELERRLARIEMLKRTAHTITDLDEFREHLRWVREQGYAVDDEESQLRNLCVAVPVHNRQGLTVAAVSTSHVKDAMVGAATVVVGEMRRVGDEISQLLGYIPSSGAVQV